MGFNKPNVLRADLSFLTIGRVRTLQITSLFLKKCFFTEKRKKVFDFSYTMFMKKKESPNFSYQFKRFFFKKNKIKLTRLYYLVFFFYGIFKVFGAWEWRAGYISHLFPFSFLYWDKFYESRNEIKNDYDRNQISFISWISIQHR